MSYSITQDVTEIIFCSTFPEALGILTKSCKNGVRFPMDSVLK